MRTEKSVVTITIPQSMERNLDAVKAGHYAGQTDDEMLKDLITRGLQTTKKREK